MIEYIYNYISTMVTKYAAYTIYDWSKFACISLALGFVIRFWIQDEKNEARIEEEVARRVRIKVREILVHTRYTLGVGIQGPLQTPGEGGRLQEVAEARKRKQLEEDRKKLQLEKEQTELNKQISDQLSDPEYQKLMTLINESVAEAWAVVEARDESKDLEIARAQVEARERLNTPK